MAKTGDSVEQIVKDFRALLERLAAFSGEAQKQRLTDSQLDCVLDALRESGVWCVSNDATLAGMTGGGAYSRPHAFQVLTAGSAPVQAVVDQVLAGGCDTPPVTLPPEPEPEPTPELTVEPEPAPEPKRRRGRPRKGE